MQQMSQKSTNCFIFFLEIQRMELMKRNSWRRTRRRERLCGQELFRLWRGSLSSWWKVGSRRRWLEDFRHKKPKSTLHHDFTRIILSWSVKVEAKLKFSLTCQNIVTFSCRFREQNKEISVVYIGLWTWQNDFGETAYEVKRSGYLWHLLR